MWYDLTGRTGQQSPVATEQRLPGNGTCDLDVAARFVTESFKIIIALALFPVCVHRPNSRCTGITHFTLCDAELHPAIRPALRSYLALFVWPYVAARFFCSAMEKIRRPSSLSWFETVTRIPVWETAV